MRDTIFYSVMAFFFLIIGIFCGMVAREPVCRDLKRTVYAQDITIKIYRVTNEVLGKNQERHTVEYTRWYKKMNKKYK